jgi:hypothetical protein
MTAAHPTPANGANAPSAPVAAPQWAARWRWLALLASILILYTTWAPWAIVSTINLGYLYPINLVEDVGSPGPGVSPVVWAALTVTGLLIIPWLWSRHFRAIAALAFALWLLLMTLALGWVAAVLLGDIARTGGALSIGAILAPLALIAGWLAAIPLLRAALRQRRAQGWLPFGVGKPRTPLPAGTPAALRARAGLVAAGAATLTAGLIVWAIAFQFLPWAVYPCGSSTLIGGACLGISSNQGLGAAFVHLPPGPALLDPLMVPSAAPILLLGGAVLLLYAVWRLPVTGRLCAWAAVWLALASGTVALTAAGIATIIAAGPTTGVGTPSAYPAGLVAAIGLALGWLALIPLVVAALSSRTRSGATAD